MRIDVDIGVAQPPARVFAVATDIARWSEIIPAIERIEMLTAGPVAVGTRFRETRRMHGVTATEDMTVAVLEPPRVFTLIAESRGTRYRATHTFEDDAGGTRLRLAFEGMPVTLAARLMTPLAWVMRGTVARQLLADLAALKRAAEAAG